MLVQARVRFRHRGSYSLPPGVTVTHLSGDGARCVCTVAGGSELDRACALVGMGAWYDGEPEVVARSPTALAVRCLCPTRGVTPAVSSAGASILWPVVHVGREERWQLVAHEPAQLAAALERMRERGDVELERLATPEVDELEGERAPELLRGLSPRQLDALHFAIERGYYELPRRVTLAQLARERGVARSTFQEHLQRAEQRVMACVAAAFWSEPSGSRRDA